MTASARILLIGALRSGPGLNVRRDTVVSAPNVRCSMATGYFLERILCYGRNPVHRAFHNMPECRSAAISPEKKGVP